eukprot:5621575-Prymnesium_polylepis.1
MSGSSEAGTFRDTGTAGVYSFERSYRTGDTRVGRGPVSSRCSSSSQSDERARAGAARACRLDGPLGRCAALT